MTAKTRKILFYASTAVFFVLSALILALALGFSYDFRNNSFVKTGSIVLAANIQADVFINEKLEGRLSLLGNSFSEKGLLPGKYKVKIQKDGFTAWQKEVEVSEGLISSFGNIFLRKSELKEKVITSKEILDKHLKASKPVTEVVINAQLPKEEIVDFSVAPDESSVVWVTGHEVWVAWTRGANYQPIKKAGEKELVTRLSENIKSVDWHKSGAYIFIRLGNKFSMLEIDTRGGINISTIYNNLGAKDVVWYDRDLDRIFKFQNGSLTAVEI